MARRFAFGLAGAVAVSLAAACVPADHALELGSVAFTLEATDATMNGKDTDDGWRLRFERIALSFKTMTIGEVGVPERCSYRGRGARADVVFDPRLYGLQQTFNGIQPTDCPDVGIVFGPPGAATTLGFGSTGQELVELLEGTRASHAIVDVVATPEGDAGSTPLRIALRFDTERTSSRFGGCRAAFRGVRIRANARDAVTVAFGAEHLFHEAISTTAPLRVQPFHLADEFFGDNDGVVTMAELDLLPLRTVRSELNSDFYQLTDGSTVGSFGDYVRQLFRFTFSFRSEGICVGNEPGEEEQQP